MATTDKPLNAQQRKLLAAINRGVGNIRDLQTAAGYPSTSTVAYNLRILADRGDIVMLKHGKSKRVYTGIDYARGWDAAAKLLGNPDA